MSIQENNAEVDAFIAQYGLDYPFLMDRTGEISTLYRVTSTPTTFFVAPDGTIVDQTAGVVSANWIEQNAMNYLGT